MGDLYVYNVYKYVTYVYIYMLHIYIYIYPRWVLIRGLACSQHYDTMNFLEQFQVMGMGRARTKPEPSLKQALPSLSRLLFSSDVYHDVCCAGSG